MTQATAAGRLLHIGCYTAGAGGAAAGLHVLVHDPVTGEWSARGSAGPDSTDDGPQSPSFLAWHPDGRHLYAVGEVENGRVWAYEVDPAGGAPRVLGSADTGGAFPCHLSVDPGGRWVVSANYGSGSLAVHALRPDGGLGTRTDLVQHRGSGPDTDRQTGPHAHMAVFVTDALVLAVDLGVDGVAAYRLDQATGRLAPAAVPWSALPAGFGPRHLVVLPDRLVALAGELSGEIALLRLDPDTGGLTLLDVQPAGATRAASAPSGIERSADGAFVLIANRGPDTIASFAVDPERETIRLVDEIDCGGAHPRAITVIDELVYVANQHGDNITVLRWDARTGALSDTGSRISTPTPTHVLGPPVPTDQAWGTPVNDYRIVRLQVQDGPMKIGRAPLRHYEPASLVPVTSLLATPRGAHGVTADGRTVMDVHHQDHPESRDRKGRAGILFMGTGDYSALRAWYGDHVIDGIAGETVLLDAPEGLAGRQLPAGVTILTAGGGLELHDVRAADPCVEFSRFCLRREPSPVVDDVVRQALVDLDGGSRGYRAVAASSGTIAIGDTIRI